MKEFVLIIQKSLTAEHVQFVKDLCEKNDYGFKLVSSQEEALPFIKQATIMYSSAAKLLPEAENLKWFHSSSAGVNTYLPLLKTETILTNSAGAYGLSIAEHIIMVLLMMLRKMPTYQQIVREKGWKKDIHFDSVYGQRITIFGTGDIGTNFARRIKAFQPKTIIGINTTGHAQEGFDKCYPIDDIDSILPKTDVLVSCVPETSKTIGYLNEHRINLLPKGSYLINVGRGSAIDEKALYTALKNKHLEAAALDVFQKEPLETNSPLYELDNLIITPHISGNMTVDYTIDKNFNMFLNNLKHYINNEPMEYLVDKEKEY